MAERLWVAFTAVVAPQAVRFGQGGSRQCGRPPDWPLPRDGPACMGGRIDRTNPQHPERDWSMLFDPECTGDVHSGSKTAHATCPETE
jgi:hypothetical protein